MNTLIETDPILRVTTGFAAETMAVDALLEGKVAQIPNYDFVPGSYGGVLKPKDSDQSQDNLLIAEDPLLGLLVLAKNFNITIPDGSTAVKPELFSASYFWDEAKKKLDFKDFYEYLEENPLLKVQLMKRIQGFIVRPGNPDAKMVAMITEAEAELAKSKQLQPNRIRNAPTSYFRWLADPDGFSADIKVEPVTGTFVPADTRRIGAESTHSRPKNYAMLALACITLGGATAVFSNLGKSHQNATAAGTTAPTTSAPIVAIEATTNQTAATYPVVVSTVPAASPETIAATEASVATSDAELTTTTATALTDTIAPVSVEPVQAPEVVPALVTTAAVPTTTSEAAAPTTTAVPNDGTLSAAACAKLEGTQFDVPSGMGLIELLKTHYTQPDGTPIDDHAALSYLKKRDFIKLLSDFRVQYLMSKNPDGTFNYECIFPQALLNKAVS